MRTEYDFSNARKNPYAKQPNRQITVSLDDGTMDYFMARSRDAGVPCQALISLYLKDCAASGRQLPVPGDG